MYDKLTFKDYLDSKARLREAVAKVPQRSAKYTVHKYCKLVLGESKNHKEYINLKPKQHIHIDWLYDDVDNPTVVNIKFEGVKDVLLESDYVTFWEGSRLQKWLDRNTFEEN